MPKPAIGEWSAWADINETCPHTNPAAYHVRLSSDGRAFGLGRLLDVDVDGLLTMGCTVRMERRRYDFVSGMTKCQGHSEANLLYLMLHHSRIKEVIPNLSVQYRYMPFETRDDAANREEQMLKQYIMHFGELPPLNCAIPDRHGKWCWDDE